jgi:hypothetical protein
MAFHLHKHFPEASEAMLMGLHWVQRLATRWVIDFPLALNGHGFNFSTLQNIGHRSRVSVSSNGATRLAAELMKDSRSATNP